MTFLVCVACSVGLVWAFVVAPRIALPVACAAFLIVGYVFGFEFLHFNAGPIPLTLDRILLVAIVAAAVWQFKTRRLRLSPSSGTDWLLISFIGFLTLNMVLNRRPAGTDGSGPQAWRLIASYWIPLVLYWITRHAPIEKRQMKWFAAIFGALGVYLAVTAIAEVTGQWWAVFPRYIRDPELGTHFGRARGPTLMAASMGVYLTACALMLWYRLSSSSRAARFAGLVFSPVFAAAVYFTYTRSVWLGAAAAILVVLALELRGTRRRLVVGGVLATGLIVTAMEWNALVGFQRETSATDTRHSVSQRASFAYVSWQMFKDRPIFGHGFGRFYDKKLPYLSDRRQSVELDSIRGLEHHNTFLGILTETGIIGFTLFLALLASFAQSGWRLATAQDAPKWMRRMAVVSLALLAAYISSATFHDLSLSPTEHWLLFTVFGITVSMQRSIARRSGAPASAKKASATPRESIRAWQPTAAAN